MIIGESDRKLGGLVHLAAIPAPFWGPAVALILFGRRPFVRYQAYKALIEQLVAIAVTITIFAISIGLTIYQFTQNGFDLSKIDWVQVIIKSLIVWLLLALFNLWNVINAIRDASTAYRGIIPAKPKWTERVALSKAV
ncbi:MAG: hypothetical protein IT363_07675 [Methanoregulaceae archaeon]|nr:hypothetical protein [Methanoregulaceae archaeon]